MFFARLLRMHTNYSTATLNIMVAMQYRRVHLQINFGSQEARDHNVLVTTSRLFRSYNKGQRSNIPRLKAIFHGENPSKMNRCRYVVC